MWRVVRAAPVRGASPPASRVEGLEPIGLEPIGGRLTGCGRLGAVLLAGRSWARLWLPLSVGASLTLFLRVLVAASSAVAGP